MAVLEDLRKKSISQLTDEELTEKLRELRLSRRTPAPSIKKEKKAKSTTVLSSSSLVDKLTPDQVALLLAKLGGADKINLNLEEEDADGLDEDNGETEDSSD